MANNKSKSGADTATMEARGPGGELHEFAGGDHTQLTTNQGLPVSDNQTSLKAGARGPILLEDFVLREKITHFDHERIPERIVHARGSAAHATFEVTDSLSDVTRAAFLGSVGKRTPAFVRFSTVAGGVGSKDTPRDVRGFAVKFYTEEGNYDLVGNNMPIFFIQDAMKFPDLIHAVKQEPDRGFPQAASAHDTFWDFASLTTESTAMLLWAMSDRALPRSLRMMEGFGVHTFRFINGAGKVTFVKFHWRPQLGMQSTTWDEAVKISGADPDYHRRDLWNAIESGKFPAFDLYVQLFDAQEASQFSFDVLDPTKLVPEELVALRKVGTLTLDRNPDNFFAENEQVAFCPANLVPGIDVSDDPLLQGRLFSYLDTQLSRLGSANFQELPINRPKCPMHNMQRDGHMRFGLPKGRVSYEPSSLDPQSAREDPRHGFQTHPASDGSGSLLRVRPESFADHYGQARLFWKSQTTVEQNHIVSAFVFELSKVETPPIRLRMIANLAHVDRELATRVARGLGLHEREVPVCPEAPEPELSPALSILGKAVPTLVGRTIGCLVSEGTDGALLGALKSALEQEGAQLELIAPTIAPVRAADGSSHAVHHQLGGAPSVLFDAIVIAVSDDGAHMLAQRGAALDFVHDAWVHAKVIGIAAEASRLSNAAGVAEGADAGVIRMSAADVASFVAAAKGGRIWQREARVNPAP